MTRRAALGLLVLATAHRAVAQAPPEVRLEAGYARVAQQQVGARDVTSDAALFAVFWRRPADRWTLFTSANLTYARDSLAAAQGVAAFAFPWTNIERLRTDIGAAGARFSLRSAGTGGNANVFARQHYVRDHGGAWIGAAGGITGRDGSHSASRVADIGAWGRYRFLYGSASVSRQNSNDWLLLATSGVYGTPFDQYFVLEDGQLALQARHGPHELSATWTQRRGVVGAEFYVVAFSASGVLQLNDRVAFLASAGRQLSDPLRGLPQADIATASIRVSVGPKPLVRQRSAVGEATVERRDGQTELVVRIVASDTLTVEVAGDFSDWQPLPLERDGNQWIARVVLPPGKYHLGIRANHGTWRAPRNLARVHDDFGGESGLIVIP